MERSQKAFLAWIVARPLADEKGRAKFAETFLNILLPAAVDNKLHLLAGLDILEKAGFDVGVEGRVFYASLLLDHKSLELRENAEQHLKENFKQWIDSPLRKSGRHARSSAATAQRIFEKAESAELQLLALTALGQAGVTEDSSEGRLANLAEERSQTYMEMAFKHSDAETRQRAAAAIQSQVELLAKRDPVRASSVLKQFVERLRQTVGTEEAVLKNQAALRSFNEWYRSFTFTRGNASQINASVVAQSMTDESLFAIAVETVKNAPADKAESRELLAQTFITLRKIILERGDGLALNATGDALFAVFGCLMKAKDMTSHYVDQALRSLTTLLQRRSGQQLLAQDALAKDAVFAVTGRYGSVTEPVLHESILAVMKEALALAKKEPAFTARTKTLLEAVLHLATHAADKSTRAEAWTLVKVLKNETPVGKDLEAKRFFSEKMLQSLVSSNAAFGRDEKVLASNLDQMKAMIEWFGKSKVKFTQDERVQESLATIRTNHGGASELMEKVRQVEASIGATQTSFSEHCELLLVKKQQREQSRAQLAAKRQRLVNDMAATRAKISNLSWQVRNYSKRAMMESGMRAKLGKYESYLRDIDRKIALIDQSLK